RSYQGLNVTVIITDPGGEESLYEAMEQKNLPLSKLHTKYVAASPSTWDALKDMARKINTMGYKDLTEIKHGISKQDYGQFLDVLDTLSNFVTDAGVELGPVDSWGPDRMLAVDSATGINMMAMSLILGAKPAAHRKLTCLLQMISLSPFYATAKAISKPIVSGALSGKNSLASIECVKTRYCFTTSTQLAGRCRWLIRILFGQLWLRIFL
ncbi:hypothetical protein LCGC14_2243440, partial [marine sediment metagenome]